MQTLLTQCVLALCVFRAHCSVTSVVENDTGYLNLEPRVVADPLMEHLPPFIATVKRWILVHDQLPFLDKVGHSAVVNENWAALDIALWLTSLDIKVANNVLISGSTRCDLEYQGNTYADVVIWVPSRSFTKYISALREAVTKLTPNRQLRSGGRRYERFVVGIAFAWGIWNAVYNTRTSGPGGFRGRIAPDINETNYVDELRRAFGTIEGLPVHYEPVQKDFFGHTVNFTLMWMQVP